MMECCSMGESERPLTIISEENRLRGGRPRRHSPLLEHHASSSRFPGHCAELVTAVSLPRHHDQSNEECTITASVSVAALPSLTRHGGHCSPPRHHHGSGSASRVIVDAALSPSASSEQSLGSEMSATAEEHTSFSKEVISFSLFGRIHPKCKRPWNESLSARIAQVQDCYKNIPPKLYFSPSSVSFEGIGVYTAEPLPQDASLGPYIGHHVSREQINGAEHNEWLWEVYESSSSLAYFVDASDPKLSNHNWMNFIQCARNSNEQNLKLTQIDDNLYFMATRDIRVGEELLVWYDEVQYGVYMGLPTGFNETREPIIEKAAMEPGAAAAAASTQQHSAAAPTPTTASYAAPGQTTVAHHVILTRNPSEHRLYNNIPNYTSAPSSAGNLSDSADSGISLSASLEQSGGGPTPPGAVGAAATTTTATGLTSSSFDRASNCSGSSTHLDMTSMSSSNKQSASVEPFHHLPSHGMQEVPVTAYHTGELYGGFHIIPATATATGSAALSQHPASAGVAVIGGAGASPHWITAAGRGRKDLSTGDVWLKTPTVGIAQPISIGSSTEVLGNRKQLLYGMFSRYEDGTRWQCEQCKKLFSSQGSLRAHARIHTGERPYQCQYCSRTFCQASTLRSHERLHTGEKPYKCEHCGRAFTQSAGLRSHLKTHRYDSL